MAIEKNKILETVLELPAKQHCQSSPFNLKIGPNGLNWKCCLAGTVKLGNKEQFDKEQIGIKEPFPVKNLPFTSYLRIRNFWH